MSDLLTREDALKVIKKWLPVYNKQWNWLSKQKMRIKLQVPDENSFMTVPYMYMEIEKEDWTVIRTPRSPSRLDIFSDTRIIV